MGIVIRVVINGRRYTWSESTLANWGELLLTEPESEDEISLVMDAENWPTDAQVSAAIGKDVRYVDVSDSDEFLGAVYATRPAQIRNGARNPSLITMENRDAVIRAIREVCGSSVSFRTGGGHGILALAIYDPGKRRARAVVSHAALTRVVQSMASDEAAALLSGSPDAAKILLSAVGIQCGPSEPRPRFTLQIFHGHTGHWVTAFDPPEYYDSRASAERARLELIDEHDVPEGHVRIREVSRR